MTIHNIILRKTLAWLNNGLRDTKVPAKQMKLCTSTIKTKQVSSDSRIMWSKSYNGYGQGKTQRWTWWQWGESDSIETSETMNHMMKE